MAWTLEGLETAFWFWSSLFPLFNANTGVNGDGMAASSEESASNFLELEIPWISKRLSKQNITRVKRV
jgi:hypothetical protein